MLKSVPVSRRIEVEVNVKKQNWERIMRLRFRPIMRRLIGSSDENDLRLYSPNVTSIHAVFILDHDSLYIADALSTSGTSVNGIPLKKGEVRLLIDGDVIGIGDVQIRIHKIFSIAPDTELKCA